MFTLPRLAVAPALGRTASSALAASLSTAAAARAGPAVKVDRKKEIQAAKGRNVVLVDAARTPFVMAGTDFKPLWSHDLLRKAFKGLLAKTQLDTEHLDYVIAGNVLQEVKTSNVAREAALGAGIPDSVPAHTVTMACISSNQALTTGASMIASGQIDSMIFGGTEVMSDVPIRFSRPLRRLMLDAQKVRSPQGWINLLKRFRPSMLAPELPAVAEFSTNEVMGHSADRLAAAFDISREAQDDFALRSHMNALEAGKAGKLSDIVPVYVPGKKEPVVADNGVRITPREKLASLNPAFVKPHGTVTAGNASFLTDGASAGLIMSEDKALELGYKPLAYIREYEYVAQDPKDELLLGPAYVTPKVLAKAGLTLDDISVFEYHEAFAGQLLANIAALESEWFCKNKLGLDAAFGSIDMDKLNNWGGSLSIGHPFAATSTRLTYHAAKRLQDADTKYALTAACAAGGLGSGNVIERYE
ncbi:3-ketoacyl-CoA thiolase [Thecamonas trahens ATCC 50062]|uniref:3-ketoacyl-CoA thiolase n=1 Tax=Thecamonas trahens ATCC 50062 TaxID=461836 RepID=A0A0L0DBG2_THETB|nr:3-ketoacyl-CoA thiolase [Thecamonas trahens ATCC 50062]KNC48633.1 3-ketoacyl-CoA thiolase [Thecamonas trahens ATCC 50062]|eukprot:XP_013762689.1 3-ketoacyl-CoA thiolase [Thecamonas trahens ATCC 50062]